MARHKNIHPFDDSTEHSKMQSTTPTLPPMSSLLPREGHSGATEHFTSSPPFPSPNEGIQSHPPSWASTSPSWQTQHSYITQNPPLSHDRHFPTHQPQVVGPQPGFVRPLNSLQDPVDQDSNFASQRQTKKIIHRHTNMTEESSQAAATSVLPQGRGNESERPYLQENNMNTYTSYTPVDAGFSPQGRLRYPSARSIPISGLLTADPSPTSQHPVPQYKIILRQQPIAARACGFGDRDRRVIDPPPILQLSIDDPTATPDEIKARLRALSFSVVHCTLMDPLSDEDTMLMPEVLDKRQQRRLMGTLVASPFIGLDEFDVEGCFYTFPDLSVRTPGTYRLLFRLVILDPSRMGPGNVVRVSASIVSEPFQVFNAKEFGGMRPSTELTKRLKNQGCLISVKKGNSAARNAGSQGRERGQGEEEEEEEDDDGGGGSEEDDDEQEGGMAAARKRKRSGDK